MSLHEFRRRNEHKTPSLPLSLLTPSLPPPFLRTCHAPSFARQGISHLCMCVHFIWFFLITIPPLYVYMDGTLPSWLSEPVVVLVLVWPRALAFRRRLGCNLESVLLACKPKLALCVGGGGRVGCDCQSSGLVLICSLGAPCPAPQGVLAVERDEATPPKGRTAHAPSRLESVVLACWSCLLVVRASHLWPSFAFVVVVSFFSPCPHRVRLRLALQSSCTQRCPCHRAAAAQEAKPPRKRSRTEVHGCLGSWLCLVYVFG